jgi:N-acetylmuramoyl-L-alanine amidase CwlA
MKINQRLISVNFTRGRNGVKPNQITPHTAVAKASSLFGWYNTPTTKSSAHFYVNAQGIIEQYVRESDTAWANSNGDSNRRSLTYETWDNIQPNDSVRTNELYESSAQLTAYLSKKYNIPLLLLTKAESLAGKSGITLHKYFANKSCPAGLDVNRIISRAKQILNINNNEMITLDQEITLQATHTKDPFNIRQEPTTQSAILGTIPQKRVWNTKRVAIGESVFGETRWYGVDNGWASAKYVKQLPCQSTPQDCSAQEKQVEELQKELALQKEVNKSLVDRIDTITPVYENCLESELHKVAQYYQDKINGK